MRKQRSTVFVWAAVFLLATCSPGRPGPGSLRGAQEHSTMIDKEKLAQRLEPIGKDAALLVRRDDTTVEQFDTPFWANGAVYRVTHLARYNPVVFTVGCAADLTVMLPRNPKGFMELAAKTGLRLNSAENRIAYVRVFLESTRDFRKRFQIVGKFGEIQLIAKPSPEETNRYKELQNKFDSVIKAPAVGDGPPWEVTLFALIGQDLAQLKAKLFPDGKLDVSESTLEKDLPIAYTR